MASNISPNLKAKIGADTSDFTKGMGTAKKELRDFEKTSNDAFSKIASAFGINTQQVEKLQSAFGGLGRKIAALGKDGSESLGKVVAAAGKAATAIGAIGIGAAVTAFKALNSEAEAFKNTIQGANIALQTQAYLNTYRQAMHDANEGIGKSIAEAEEEVKKGWGRIRQNINSTLAVSVAGSNGKWYDALLPTGIIRSAKQVGEQAERAKKAAEDASDVAGVIYDITRRQADATRDWADQESRINELKRIAADPEESTLARTKAIAEAEELIRKKRAEQYDLQLMISNLMDLMSSLASDGTAEADAANRAYVEAQGNLASMESELKALQRQQSSITKLAQSEASARRETAEAIAKGVSRMQEYATAQIDMFVSDESVAAIQNKLGEALAVAPIQVPVGLDIAPAEQAVLDLNDVIQQTMVEGIEGIAEAIGTLLGNLMTGEGGVADFGHDLLEMVGTFAQKFGKVLVAFGVAAEAFQASLRPPFNGIPAIVAGAALIAAGAAVKAVASSMASSMSGASSAGSYVASSAMSGGGDYDSRMLKVEVTGTLTANGSQLVAVLNNENNRKYYAS